MLLLSVPIEQITGHRMSQVRHVHPYLMGASSCRPHFKITQPVCQLFQDSPAGYRLPAALLLYSHLFPVGPVAANRLRETALLFFRLPGHKGMVYLFYLPGLEKLHQVMVGSVAFGNYHYPGSILIKAMNNTGPLKAAYSGKIFAMIPKGFSS